jgi:hypothetical protein
LALCARVGPSERGCPARRGTWLKGPPGRS